jgi:cyclophilin family peptidyl-prolyl cis-trans isomerase
MIPNIITCIIIAIFAIGCAPKNETQNTTQTEPTTEPPKAVDQPIGTITLELYPEKAPKTVARIKQLIEEGFYNEQRFHRVEEWVIQWGDPQSKQDNWRELRVGTQGSGQQLDFEENDIPMQAGTLAMASTGEKVGGDSQMFILTTACMPEQANFLQGKYAAFGKVVEGMDVVDKIRQGQRIEMKILPNQDNKTIKVQITVLPE